MTPDPTPPTGRPGRSRTDNATHLGVVAGTVLRAARLSAGLSQAALATAATVTPGIVRSWENGSRPLASVPMPDVAQLETALRVHGADQQLIADLCAAAWCDLIILAVADHEDPTCLIADPVTSEVPFRELLTWSLTGSVPARYRPYAAEQPLVDPDLADRIMYVLDPIHPPLAAACLSAE